MKRLFPLLLILVLLLGACTKVQDAPELYGYYKGTTIDAEGYEIPMESVYAGENYLSLRAEGKGELCLAGNLYDICWEYKREELCVTLKDEDSIGTVKNGVILLNYLDMGMELKFVYDKDYVPESQRELSAQQQWWNGDWYGWWSIEEATGSFAGLAGSWWDLCVKITVDGSNRGTMLLWDQDGSMEEPLGEVSFALNEDGAAVSREGYFGSVVIGQGDWYIDPQSVGTENMIVISNGGENETGSFYYTAYLRPWGQDWEGLEQKPYHYESWYLPFINSQQSMPDKLPEIS